MATFTTDYGTLDQKAARLEEHANQYEAISKQLHTTATSMGNAYESEDNKAFVTQIEAMCRDLQALVERLRNASGVLKAQANMYRQQEASNTSAANSLH